MGITKSDKSLYENTYKDSKGTITNCSFNDPELFKDSDNPSNFPLIEYLFNIILEISCFALVFVIQLLQTTNLTKVYIIKPLLQMS